MQKPPPGDVQTKQGEVPKNDGEKTENTGRYLTSRPTKWKVYGAQKKKKKISKFDIVEGGDLAFTLLEQNGGKERNWGSTRDKNLPGRGSIEERKRHPARGKQGRCYEQGPTQPKDARGEGQPWEKKIT